MRPTSLELLHGIRSLLAQEILPAVAAPHLRAQVMLAVGMLNSAVAELEDGAVASADEHTRLLELAAAMLPAIDRLAADTSLADGIRTLALAPPITSHRALSTELDASATRLGILDRLSAFCDSHADDMEAAALGRRVDAELRAVTARRLRWIGGGPPG